MKFAFDLCCEVINVKNYRPFPFAENSTRLETAEVYGSTPLLAGSKGDKREATRRLSQVSTGAHGSCDQFRKNEAHEEEI